MQAAKKVEIGMVNDFDHTIGKLGLDTSLSIRCPRCGKRAICDLPFEHYNERKPPPEHEDRPVRKASGGYILEKYPSIFPWTPENIKRNTKETVRIVKCTACHLVATHVLRWPEDAYYRWNIRGCVLWTYSSEQARVLLEYLRGAEREPSRFGAYAYYLRKLPKRAISAKNRDLVVREISKTLLKGD